MHNLQQAAIHYLGGLGYHTTIDRDIERDCYQITCRKEDLYYTVMTTDISQECIRHFAREIQHAFEARGSLLRPGVARVRYPDHQRPHNMTATEILTRRESLGRSLSIGSGREGPGIQQWMRIKDDWTDIADFQRRCLHYGFPASIPGLKLTSKYIDKVFKLDEEES